MQESATNFLNISKINVYVKEKAIKNLMAEMGVRTEQELYALHSSNRAKSG